MRKFLVVATLLALLPAAGRSQETPKAEVFGGFAYSRIEGSDFHGWNVDVTGNLHPALGIAASASGGYNSESATTVFGQTESKSSVHTFLVGPRVFARGTKYFTPFAHLMLGFARVNNDVTITSGNVTNNSTDGLNGFALVAGGGLDIRGSSALSFRLVQIDYLLLHSRSQKPQGVRISTGLVLNLGKRPQ